MKNYYEDFLKEKTFPDTQESEVSKVSKGQNIFVDAQNTEVSKVSKAPDDFEYSLNTEVSKVSKGQFSGEIEALETESFTETLNRLIGRGVSFDVSAESFIICGENLASPEMNFIEANSLAILCTLQQALLFKHVFSAAPEKIEIFGSHIAEAETAEKSRVEAVCEVSARWFKHLLAKVIN